MTTSKISDQVRGKTIRLTWTEGPTKGTAQDHVFHADGTVEWHEAGGDKQEKSSSTDSGDRAAKKAEKPAYAGVKITDDVCLISYLSQSGYTLTVTLNFRDGTTVGVASNEETWIPVKGTFEALR
ncbi:MAG: hypothetical protein Q7K57_28335 [Burkholderiaceae bacterium]|nr:hypothetical protein [Burkholderiaceae bacterium]